MVYLFYIFSYICHCADRCMSDVSDRHSSHTCHIAVRRPAPRAGAAPGACGGGAQRAPRGRVSSDVSTVRARTVITQYIED